VKALPSLQLLHNRPDRRSSKSCSILFGGQIRILCELAIKARLQKGNQQGTLKPSASRAEPIVSGPFTPIAWRAAQITRSPASYSSNARHLGIKPLQPVE
jgi:hypothetical protein